MHFIFYMFFGILYESALLALSFRRADTGVHPPYVLWRALWMCGRMPCRCVDCSLASM